MTDHSTPVPHLSLPSITKRAPWQDRHETRVSNWMSLWDFSEEIDAGLIGAPYSAASISASGAAGGPEAVRTAFKFNTTFSPDWDTDVQRLRVRDLGDIGGHLTDVSIAHANIEAAVHGALTHAAPFVPVIVGGDHSITAPAVRGFCAANPGKRVGIVNIDAHLDVRTMDGVGPHNGTPFHTQDGLLEMDDREFQHESFRGRLGIVPRVVTVAVSSRLFAAQRGTMTGVRRGESTDRAVGGDGAAHASERFSAWAISTCVIHGDKGRNGNPKIDADSIGSAVEAAERVSGTILLKLRRSLVIYRRIYLVLNPTDLALPSQCDDRMEEGAPLGPKDVDFRCLRSFSVEVDPPRRTGITTSTGDRAVACSDDQSIEAYPSPGGQPSERGFIARLLATDGAAAVAADPLA